MELGDREIRRSTREPDRRGPARGDDRSFVRPQTGTPRRAAVQRHQDFLTNRLGDISAFLCNILEANNVKPKRVLKPRTFLPTTCSTLPLFRLCSRLLSPTCLKQLRLTQTLLVLTIP